MGSYFMTLNHEGWDMPVGVGSFESLEEAEKFALDLDERNFFEGCDITVEKHAELNMVVSGIKTGELNVLSSRSAGGKWYWEGEWVKVDDPEPRSDFDVDPLSGYSRADEDWFFDNDGKA